MKSGHGSLRWIRTRPGSTIWTSRTRSLSSFADAPRYRSNENLTSAAVTGSPLWNFTPRRITNSYVRPSFDAVHDSARLGVLLFPGIGFTSASWMRSEEHTSELQSRPHLVCRLLLVYKKT